MKLPRTISQITRDWLDRALSLRYPSVSLESLDVVDIIATTATKVRLRLTFTHAGEEYGLPATMILKGGLAGLSHEVELRLLYRNEGVFYHDVAPSLDIELPRCFYAGADGETGLVLLEDLVLQGATFGGGARPLAPEKVCAALEYQADFHARWWGGDSGPLRGLMSFEDFFSWFWSQPWLVGVGAKNSMTASRSDSLLTQARTAVSDLAGFKRAVLAAHAFNLRAPQCLVHVDPHPGNMYFSAAGEPRWLDWQLATRGCWAWDVAYFTIGALTIADRREHEKELLQRYLERLRTNGVAAPVWDDAWLAYRRNAIWGISWALVPEQMQSAENGNPIIERFAAAIKDLGAMESLGLRADAYDFDLGSHHVVGGKQIPPAH